MKKFLLYFLLPLFVGKQMTYSQSTFGVDSLMKLKKLGASTQYECDTEGKNCNIVYRYNYDTSGRLIKHVEYSDNKPFLTRFYVYGRFNKVDTVYLQFAGQKKYISQIYKYNNKGAATEYYECFEKEGCELKQNYEYTPGGLLKKEVKYNGGKLYYEMTHLYNASGNNIETITKFRASNAVVKQTHFFNNKNEKIKSIGYGPDGTRLDSTIYEYDNNGRVIFSNWMGGLNTKYSYKFDDGGNQIEYKSTALNGKINDHRIMNYLNGLLMSRIHYNNGQIRSYFRFEYTSY